MALRWIDSDHQVLNIPQERRHFYDTISRHIHNLDPNAHNAIIQEICTHFQALPDDAHDFISVPRMAPGTWIGTPLQVIHDATNDDDLAKWWLGLLVMNTAIKYHQHLTAYKPGSEDAIEYRLDTTRNYPRA